MPMFSSIADQLRTPPPVDPVESMTRALTLRSLMDQRAQNRQIGQMNLDLHKQTLADHQRAAKLAEDTQAVYAAGGDPASTEANLLKVNAAAGLALGKARRENAKSDAEVQQAQIKLHTEQIGQVASASGALLNLPPESRAAAYPQMREALIAKKLATPEDLPEQYPGDAWMHQQHDKGLTAKDQLDQEAKAADEARKAALAAPTLAKLTAEANIQTADAAQVARPVLDANGQPVLGPDGKPKLQGMTDKDAQQIAQTAKRDTNTATNEAAIRKQGDQRIGIAGAELGISQQRVAIEKARYGFETSGGVSPAAQMAVEGKMDPSTLKSILRTNPGLIGQIRTLDPNFDIADIDRRFGTLKEFNSTSNGKAGGQALALNTLIHHADLYMQAAEALKNGNFKPGNAAYNAVASAFGSAPPQNAALVARFFAGETGKVATGGVPAEGEINGILKNLGTDAGPDQIAGAGKTLLQIAAGRATPLMERVKEAKLDNVVHVMGADAKEILARRGFDPETMKVKGAAAAGGGATYSKTATGPNGHKIGSNDGKTWVDLQTGQKVQ